jgi:hypothetical protein
MRRLTVFCVTVLALGCGGTASDGPADEKNSKAANAQPASQQSGNNAEARFKDKPVSVWARQLQDRDVTTRIEAAKALQALGPQARAAVPDLKTALKERTWELLATHVPRDANRVFTTVSGLIAATGGGVPSKDQIIADLRRQLDEKNRELVTLQKKQHELTHDPCLRALGFALLAVDRQELEAMFPPPDERPATRTFSKVGGTIGSTNGQ